MRFSVMTEPQLGGTYAQILDVARWAERRGLVSFARSDHYYSGRRPRPDATDAWATLAGLARETDHIRLCVLVTPITFRHPAVIAKMAATVDQMSGGRFDLGVGTGWMEAEHQAFGLDFPEWAERFDRLTETLGYLEAAFSPEPGAFSGAHYRLDAEVEPKPAGLRMVVGGNGPRRTPALAAVHADEYNQTVSPPDRIAARISTMRREAEAAGRDPDSIEATVMGPVVVGADQAEYADLVAAGAARRDISPTEYEERLTNAGVPCGPVDRVSEFLGELETAGVSRYYLQWLDLADLDGLDHAFGLVAGR